MTTSQYTVRLTVTVDLDEYEKCYGDKIRTSAGITELIPFKAGPGPYAAAHILEAAEERLADCGGWATIGDEVFIELVAPHDGTGPTGGILRVSPDGAEA